MATAIPSAAAGQSMSMPGMAMPMSKAPANKGAAKVDQKKHVSHAVSPQKTRAKPAPGTAPSMPTGGAMPVPMSRNATSAPEQSMPMSGSRMAPMQAHGPLETSMTAALGPYPMQRESSGTAWQPDASEPMSLMTATGGWTLMAHGLANLVYDHQSGPRGADKAFASGMLMGMARRPLGNGSLQLRAMVSPEPLMGPRGYPLLLASGETANGRDRLIDRQHPHDFFMELSGSVSQNLGSDSSVFVYAGIPGEPAFGPPAFMHREAIMDSPEAPITHHWLDSTHISFGVVTAGLVLGRAKIEASRFNGREPDQHRWDIETGPLDSTAIRLSWNPTRTLALQGSWGHFTEPEQLEPGVNQTRWSASALWAAEIAPGWKAAATLAWGRKVIRGHKDEAAALEASLRHHGWTVFGRTEVAQNRELLDVEDRPAYSVGKVSLGAIRDFPFGDHVSLGAGGLFSVNFLPGALVPLYGGHNPTGTMGFVRLKLN